MNNTLLRETLATKDRQLTGSAPSPEHNILAPLRTPKGWRSYLTAALVAAGLGSLLMPKVSAQSLDSSLAPNGKPWIEGEKFAPFVNTSIEPQVKFFDKLHWTLREFARTNTQPYVDLSQSCTGQLLPPVLEQSMLDLLMFRRSQHGLTNQVTIAIPPDAGFTKSDIADTTIYLSRLGFSTHSPGDYTNALHYGCLTPQIKNVARDSLLAGYFPGTGYTINKFFLPAQAIDFLVADDELTIRHREMIYERELQSVGFGATPMRYHPDILRGTFSPISFSGDSTKPNIFIVTPFTGNLFFAPAHTRVFPPAGAILSEYSPIGYPANPAGVLADIMVPHYDFTLSGDRLKVEVVNESINNTPVKTSIVSVSEDLYGRNLSWLVYKSGDYRTLSNAPTVFRVTVSNAFFRGDTERTSPETFSYRYAIYPDPGIRLEVKKDGSRVSVSFPAAHLYDGAVLPSRFGKFSPWQIECSGSPDFATLIDPQTLSNLRVEYSDGVCTLSFDEAGAPKYFRLKKKPGTPFQGPE